MMGPTDEHDLLKGGGGDCALYFSQFSKLGIFLVVYYSLEGGEMLVTGEASCPNGEGAITPPPINMLEEALVMTEFGGQLYRLPKMSNEAYMCVRIIHAPLRAAGAKHPSLFLNLNIS